MPSLEIVVPAFNEAGRLESGFLALKKWLCGNGFPDAKICIAENGSRDATPEIADALARRHAGTRVLHLPKADLAGALLCAWKSSDAKILGYCDADMSTDLSHIAEALEILKARKNCVLVSGSRHLPGACVVGRNFRRRVVSRIYAACVNFALGTHFTDSACGFKFLRRAWFEEIAETAVARDFALGAELMWLAEKRSADSLVEIPVRWTECAGTHVRLLPTIFSSAKNVLKVKFTHQIRFRRSAK